MNKRQDKMTNGRIAAYAIAPLMILCCAAPLVLPTLFASAAAAGWFAGVNGMVLIAALVAVLALVAYGIHRRRRERSVGRQMEMARQERPETS